MEKYRVVPQDAALRDIDSIYDYIADVLLEPGTALKISDGIFDAIETLNFMPQRCPPVLEDALVEFGYRKLIIKNYIAFFTIDEDNREVHVERVLSARTDWANWL